MSLSLPFEFQGEVIRGKQRARKLLFPTANIRVMKPEHFFPDFGVYACRVTVQGSTYLGALSAGVAETFDDIEMPRIEVHILDFDLDIYAEKVTIRLERYLRDMKKFESSEALQRQILQDIINVRSLPARQANGARAE